MLSYGMNNLTQFETAPTTVAFPSIFSNVIQPLPPELPIAPSKIKYVPNVSVVVQIFDEIYLQNGAS